MVCGSEIWMLALETNGRENLELLLERYLESLIYACK